MVLEVVALEQVSTETEICNISSTVCSNMLLSV